MSKDAGSCINTSPPISPTMITKTNEGLTESVTSFEPTPVTPVCLRFGFRVDGRPYVSFGILHGVWRTLALGFERFGFERIVNIPWRGDDNNLGSSPENEQSF